MKNQCEMSLIESISPSSLESTVLPYVFLHLFPEYVIFVRYLPIDFFLFAIIEENSK